MGTYTTMMMAPRVNDAGHVAAIALAGSGSGWDDAEAALRAAGHGRAADAVAGFKVMRRASFIPHGGGSAPWADYGLEANAPGWSPDSYHKDELGMTCQMVDGRWHVFCTLKNYDGEIEAFLEGVLPLLIAAPVLVMVWYEEHDEAEECWIGPSDEMQQLCALLTGE